jgi:hypothetical protein
MPYAAPDGAKGKGTANIFDYAVGTGITIGDGRVAHYILFVVVVVVLVLLITNWRGILVEDTS